MGVSIDQELEKVAQWQEIRDYVNKRMIEEDWEETIFIRSATCEEAAKLREKGKNLLLLRQEDGTMELIIRSGKYLDFEETEKLAKSLDPKAPNTRILMHLLIAQMVGMGKTLGGCDS